MQSEKKENSELPSQEELINEIKELIISECDKDDDFCASDILDDEQLFGKKSRLELDSLDALQLSLALKKRYSISIEGSKETRKHMHSALAISQFILKR